MFVDQVTTSKPYPPYFKSYISAIVLIQLIYFFFFDWSNSLESPFTEAAEAFESLNTGKSKTKNIIIENNQKSMKMIIYAERRDGGIQGILLDLYINEETGEVANEFLTIHEKENGEIEFVKVEQGLRQISDKN